MPKKSLRSGPNSVRRVVGAGNSQGPVFTGKGVSGTSVPYTGFGGSGRKPFGVGSMESWRESRMGPLKGRVESTEAVPTKK